jgi:SAM-dependent methyltransferase
MQVGTLHIQRAQSVIEAYDWQYLLDDYIRLVKSTDAVLEIGSSTLDRTRELASRCASLTGVEYFAERVPADFANVRYIHGNWERLSDVIPAGSIDLAVSSHVIEHVPNDLLALEELHKVLKPGGAALLTTPNRKRLIRAIIEAVSKERQFPWWEHQREYVEDDLVRLIARSPFTQYTIDPVGVGLQGGPLHLYLDLVPQGLRRFANVWLIKLTR